MFKLKFIRVINEDTKIRVKIYLLLEPKKILIAPDSGYTKLSLDFSGPNILFDLTHLDTSIIEKIEE